MPYHALPPHTKIDVTNMMTVMSVEVMAPRRIMAFIEIRSASIASWSASSKSCRSKSSRPQVFTARMLVTASESTPESLLCAAAVFADSGRMRWYMR